MTEPLNYTMICWTIFGLEDDQAWKSPKGVEWITLGAWNDDRVVIRAIVEKMDAQLAK